MAQWDAMAWQVAGRYHRRTARGDIADYHAQAVLGAWEAACRFDPATGFSFATYARWWMIRRAGDLARQEAAAGANVPNHEGITRVPTLAFGEIQAEYGSENTTPFEQDVPGREPDPAAVDRLADAAEFWRRAAAVLRPRELAVLRARRVDGLLLEEVGRRLRLSRERVRQIEKRAVERLREKKAAFAGFLGD